MLSGFKICYLDLEYAVWIKIALILVVFYLCP